MRTEMVLDAIEMARSGTWGSRHVPSQQPARSSTVLPKLRSSRGNPSPPSTTLFGTIPVPYTRLTEGAALILVKESTKPGGVPADHVESTGGTPIALSFPSSAVSRIQSVSNPIGGLRQSESGHPNPPRTKGA